MINIEKRKKMNLEKCMMAVVFHREFPYESHHERISRLGTAPQTFRINLCRAVCRKLKCQGVRWASTRQKDRHTVMQTKINRQTDR